jgi:hypothetical protein
MRIMKLIEATKSTHVEVNRSLLLLEKEGITTYIRFGRDCIIRLNFDNEKTQLLLTALAILDAYDFENQPKSYKTACYNKKPYYHEYDNKELISSIEKQPILTQ